MRVPNPVIAVVADELQKRYTHAELNRLFMEADAPGEVPEGNKLVKCTEWLKRLNEAEISDPLSVLGALLENYMEVEIGEDYPEEWTSTWNSGCERVARALAKNGLNYHQGGNILIAATSVPVRSLDEMLRQRDIPAVMEELGSIAESIETKPKEAITAACAMIESLCKVYIADEGLETPADQSVKSLWKVVSKSLGFDPASIEDDDLKKVLSGLISIVDGLGSFRTHAGSTHGHGHKTYKPRPRHARLVAGAACALAAFVIETWDERKGC
jgi:Abortive infection C-terminus